LSFPSVRQCLLLHVDGMPLAIDLLVVLRVGMRAEIGASTKQYDLGALFERAPQPHVSQALWCVSPTDTVLCGGVVQGVGVVLEAWRVPVDVSSSKPGVITTLARVQAAGHDDHDVRVLLDASAVSLLVQTPDGNEARA
jgi:hypothetical protein